METVIECQEIRRTFSSRTLLGKKQETHALNGLNFNVPKGIVFEPPHGSLVHRARMRRSSASITGTRGGRAAPDDPGGASRPSAPGA